MARGTARSEKLFLLFSCIFMFFLLPAAKGECSAFSTVPKGHWAYSDIEYLKAKGLLDPGDSSAAESFADRGEAASALSKSLSGFDASNATAEEKENLCRLLAYFEPELRAVGLSFSASAKPVRAAKPGLKTRFEIAGLVSKAIGSVDREKADREDVERLQRLGTEYRNELAVWGTPVDELEDRVDVLESGMGGWHFSGSLRFDANYYRAGAVGSEGYGIYTDVSGRNEDFRFSRMRLNIRKRVDDRLTFYGRLEKDPGSGNNAVTLEHAYVDVTFPGNWSLLAGRWQTDWQGEDELYFGDDPFLTNRTLTGFLFRNDRGMGRFSAYISQQDESADQAESLEAGMRYRLDLNERFWISLNAIHLEPEDRSRQQVMWAAAGLRLNQDWSVRAAVYRQDTVDATPVAFQAILEGRQSERGLTSFWLEFLSFDKGFEMWNRGFQDYGTFMGWYDGKTGHATAPVGDYFDNVLFVRLDQKWDEKISTFQRYVLALSRGAGENAMNFTVGLRYRYTPGLSFTLSYDKVEEAYGEALDDHLIQLRTELNF